MLESHRSELQDGSASHLGCLVFEVLSCPVSDTILSLRDRVLAPDPELLRTGNLIEAVWNKYRDTSGVSYIIRDALV